MKIFQIGLDETALDYLVSKKISIETYPVTCVEELSDLMDDTNVQASVINFDFVGWSVHTVRYLRQKHGALAIISLASASCMPSWSDHRSRVLEYGADDLLQNPVNPRELTASIEAILRRSNHKVPLQDSACYYIKHDEYTLEVNLATQRVIVNGQSLQLTQKEIMLFSLLLAGGDCVQSRQTLNDQIHSPGYNSVDPTVVDVLVYRIRSKLRACVEPAGNVIETIRGRGFRIPVAIKRLRGATPH